MSQTAPDTLVARHQILNALANHSRGVDRADANLLASAYHEGATVDYGFFVGPAATQVDILAGAQKGALPTLHRTCNSEIRIDGDHARGESYVIAYVEDAEIYRMVFGRYLDRFERKGGRWAISHRSYVLDANMNQPNGCQRADPPVWPAPFVPQGGKGAADPGRVLITHHQASSSAQQKASPAMSDTQLTAALDQALSRDAIRRLATSYCRAADRADGELMASIFWEDSTVVSGFIDGSGPEFAKGITEVIRGNLQGCFHSIANEWIEVEGDHGVGEHYVIALSRAGGTDTLTGGRYVDRYERRGGVWKIASRTFVCDWTQGGPSTHESEGFYEALKNRGAFGKGDPVYALWAELEAAQ